MRSKRQLTLDWCVLSGLEQTLWESLHNKIWRNIRSDGGYRLTPFGLTFLDDLELKSWKIKIKNTQANAGNIMLAMDRFLKSPYHVDTKGAMLTIFDGDLATQILLYDGDLGAFLAAQQGLSY